MRGFLCANLFLLGLVLVGAIFSAIGAALLDALGQASGRTLALVWIGAGLAATIATGYVGAHVHAVIARRLLR